jgi:hypothetical protein
VAVEVLSHAREVERRHVIVSKLTISRPDLQRARWTTPPGGRGSTVDGVPPGAASAASVVKGGRGAGRRAGSEGIGKPKWSVRQQVMGQSASHRAVNEAPRGKGAVEG